MTLDQREQPFYHGCSTSVFRPRTFALHTSAVSLLYFFVNAAFDATTVLVRLFLEHFARQELPCGPSAGSSA